MRKSRILPSKEHSLQTTEPLTADYIQRLLTECNWVSELKESLLFPQSYKGIQVFHY